ncbi:hypothetical protein Tco_1443648 [Tanacetum coccineum]
MPTDPHHTPIITQPSSSQPQKKQKSRRPKKKDTKVPQPSDPTNVANKAVNEEIDDSLARAATAATGLDVEQDRGTTSGIRAKEITSLKRRVKRLEKKGGSRTHMLKRFYMVGLSVRVESSDEASMGDQEDASKQGRKIDDIDADINITLVNDAVNDQDMFDVNDLAGEKVFVAEQGVPDSKKDNAAQVNIAVTTVSTASTIPVSTATITKDEITLAQALAELKSIKPKVTTVTTSTTKGILLQDPSESITTTITIPSKDKGKCIMVEEPTKMKKKDQISFDEQEAIRLQAEFDEEDRLAREKNEANVALTKEWNDIQKIRKHFAAKRAEEKRNKPPIRAQQRSIMCTYLKNMLGWKPKDLKNKSFANIQEFFDKAMKRVNTFVAMDIELVKAEVDEDKEIAKLQSLMKVVPDEEEVAVDAIPLATKPPSIKLVKAKHGYTRPEEDYERVLWGDLKTMFEPHVEDLVWRNLQGNKVLIWKLFDSCEIHFVRFQNLHVFMSVEKNYPLTPATITDMLNKKIQADHWNEMCYQLLKLITKQLKNQ